VAYYQTHHHVNAVVEQMAEKEVMAVTGTPFFSFHLKHRMVRNEEVVYYQMDVAMVPSLL
jgi:hypothetical protein